MLVAQNKRKEALELLSGELGAKCYDSFELSKQRLSLMLELELWAEANAFCGEQLRGGNNDWSIYLAYLDTRQKLNEETATSDAQQLIEECIAVSTAPVRSHYLALVELRHRQNQRDYSMLADAVTRYFERFGAKPSCCHDLNAYLGGWPAESCTLLLEKFQTVADSAFSGEAAGMAHANMELIRYRLASAQEVSTPYQLTEATITRLKQYFNAKNSASYGQIYVATAHLVQAYRNTLNPAHLLVLASVLEVAYEQDKLHFQFPLLLCRIYTLLGT